GYDAADRLTSLIHFGPGGVDFTDPIIASYNYAYDAADRLTSQTAAGVTTSYAYDAADQLTQDGAANHGYDLNGNRTDAGYSTGAGNRLLSGGGVSFTYDAEGNVVAATGGAGGDWTYGYDQANHLLWAELRQGGALQRRVDFKYDAFGNRVEESVT